MPILWRLPETKGLSLEEVAAVFGEDDYAMDGAGSDLKELNDQVRSTLIKDRI